MFDVAITLLNGAVPARRSNYSPDEVVAPVAAVEVQRYVGRSDWRHDSRTLVEKKSAFDDEGGIAQTTTVTAPGCSWSPSAVVGQRPASGTLTGPCFAGSLAPSGLQSHLTFWTDQCKIPVAARPELALWLRCYKGHHANLAGTSYELTLHDPLNGKSPMVLEPWNGDHGLVFAFWQSAAPAAPAVGAVAGGRGVPSIPRGGRPLGSGPRDFLRLVPAYGTGHSPQRSVLRAGPQVTPA